MILLTYFIILLIIYKKYKSIVNIFIGLQILSLSAMFLLTSEFPINNFEHILYLVYTILILSLVITPWKDYNGIKNITVHDSSKVKRLTRFILIISSYNFVIFLTAAIIINLAYTDVNEFKYTEGLFMEVIYSELPFSARFFLLSIYLNPLSYFLIPLHFYYLIKRDHVLAILSFVFSLNIVLHGLTFYSRWTLVHYLMLYGTFYFMFRKSLAREQTRKIRLAFLIIGALLISRFIAISFSRFENNIHYQKKTIAIDSKVQDITLYSNLSYLSQWYNNNMELLDGYRFETFNGQHTFGSILGILGRYGFSDYSAGSFMKLRRHLMKHKYKDFTGLVAGWVYDFGYLLTLFIAILYFNVVKKLKPIRGNISILNSFSMVLLIQIPLTAIFYSSLGALIIPSLFLFPINSYLKSR